MRCTPSITTYFASVAAQRWAFLASAALDLVYRVATVAATTFFGGGYTVPRQQQFVSEGEVLAEDEVRCENMTEDEPGHDEDAEIGEVRQEKQEKPSPGKKVLESGIWSTNLEKIECERTQMEVMNQKRVKYEPAEVIIVVLLNDPACKS